MSSGTRREKAVRTPPAGGGATRRGAIGPRHFGALLFVLALALRLLFWQATPDAAGPHSAAYKGDSLLWLDHAQALLEGRPFELDLPLRAPGTAWLIAGIWDGEASSVPTPRFVWCLLGALAVPFLYGSALRGFGFPVASAVGLGSAASSGLMVLASSLDSETPYLLLVAMSLWVGSRFRGESPPGLLPLAAWAFLGALACLVRAEHALFFGLWGLALAVGWWRRGEARTVARAQAIAGRLALIGLVFALTLLPWHLRAWGAIDRFNHRAPELPPATERALAEVERALAGLPWEEGARARRDQLPAAVRRTAASFIAATVAAAGGTRVRAEDFAILEEAFGSVPEPLPAHPFIALSGGLNFYLANHAGATGGFSRAPLEAPPPLLGGPARYPAFLIAGLPPRDLALTYPPHLAAINHGHALGWRWIRAHPGDALALAGRKLRNFWQGATLGFTGFNLPLGASGLRRKVDLTVPEGPLASIWRLLLLALVLAGLAAWAKLDREHRRAGLPWLLWLGSYLIVAVIFYGYARQGAVLTPVVVLLVALGVERFGPRRLARLSLPWGLGRRPWLAVALALLVIEGVRFAGGPTVFLDGREVGSREPFPADRFEDRHLEVRWP